MKHYEGDMALVGYARVSSVGQSIDVQLDKLKQCDKIYQKKKSGTGKRSKLEAHRREQGNLYQNTDERLQPLKGKCVSLPR